MSRQQLIRLATWALIVVVAVALIYVIAAPRLR
jgi:hypothetical protein